MLFPRLPLAPCVLHLPLPYSVPQDSNLWIGLPWALSPLAQPGEAPDVRGQDERDSGAWIPRPLLPQHHGSGPGFLPPRLQTSLHSWTTTHSSSALASQCPVTLPAPL